MPYGVGAPKPPGAPRPPSALNPTLYAALRLHFGRVLVSNEGDPARLGAPILGPGGRPCANFVDEGEYYRINCPYCDDTRFRLYVNHLWPTEDPVSGRPMHFLAVCYNEDCLKAHYRDFYDRVLGPTTQAQRDALRAMHAAVPKPVFDPDAPELAPCGLPGELTPVDRLKPSHTAAAYLDARGFDRRELAARWEVGYCTRGGGLYPQATGRIIAPVRMESERVSWQGRWPGDDWKRRGVQKYYNLPGAKKSRLLYNRDEAIRRRYVVVCEGITDVWAFGQGAVSTLGKAIGGRQRDLLAAWAAKDGLLVLLLDPGAFTTEVKPAQRERAAQQHAQLVAELRATFRGRFAEVALPDGRDPGSFPRRTLRDLVRAGVAAAGFDPLAFKMTRKG